MVMNIGKCDGALGGRLKKHLEDLGIESPGNQKMYRGPEKAKEEFRCGVHDGLLFLGVDMDDPSMQNTPQRYADMIVDELCYGLDYNNFPKCTAQPNDMKYDELVILKKLQVTSLCEHHLQTIDGFAHVAYIPDAKVLGLSKFARIVDFFCRRPQVQERLTAQIFESLKFILETDDVAVIIDATHFCMKARGALQQHSTTQTNKMGGRFRTNDALRREFLDGTR